MAWAQRIQEILKQSGLLDELQMRSALAHQDQWGGRLAHIVVERKFAKESAVMDALAKGLSVQRLHPETHPKDAGALAKLDAEFCEKHGVFPLALRDQGKALLVAMADPTDLETVDEVGRRARSRVLVGLAGEGEIRVAIDRHYRNREGPPAALGFRDAAADARATAQAGAPTQPSPALPTEQLLDDLMGGTPPAFSAEDLERLRTIAENQEKSGKILRALQELLAEKGII
jgi:hypothetical protein